MINKYKTKILEIWRESDHAIAFKLAKPKGFEYKAGQFVYVELPFIDGDPKKKVDLAFN